MMPLKPEVSIGVGLATAGVVFSIYNGALPSVTDVRAANAADPDAESAERLAAWTAAGVVAGISLIAKDPTIFIIGGSMAVALSWWHRHANMVDPETGFASLAGLVREPDPSAAGELDDVAA